MLFTELTRVCVQVKTVVFTGDKIRSIRVYWDQATVLKQLQIVGPRGRGWPITDGNSQIELITKTGISNYPIFPNSTVVPIEKPKAVQGTLFE
jgi:hypothetical protein